MLSRSHSWFFVFFFRIPSFKSIKLNLPYQIQNRPEISSHRAQNLKIQFTYCSFSPHVEIQQWFFFIHCKWFAVTVLTINSPTTKHSLEWDESTQFFSLWECPSFPCELHRYAEFFLVVRKRQTFLSFLFHYGQGGGTTSSNSGNYVI